MKPPSLSKLSMTLVIFTSCNLFLLINDSSKPKHSAASTTAAENAVEPIGFIASRLSAIAMVYLSSMAYLGDHPSVENLLKRMHGSWKQPAITMVYIELLNTAAASLLLMLASAGRAASGAGAEAVVIAGAVSLISWLGPVLFAHSEAACRVGMVVSVAEGCEGEKALERAGELVAERKAVGFGLMVVTVVVEQGMSKVCGLGAGGSMVQLLAKFFTYFVYTTFYYDCKERSSHEGGWFL